MKKFKLIKEAVRIACEKHTSSYIHIWHDGSGFISDEPKTDNIIVAFSDEDHMIEKLSAYVKTNGFDEHPK